MIYTIKRGDYTILSKELDGQQVRSKMGEDIVEVEFEHPYKIDFKKNDMIHVYGNTYLLDYMPVSQVKLDSNWYEYKLRFVAEWYRVTEINFCGYNSSNQLSESETQFEVMGDVDTFLTLIIANLNRVDNGWTKGDVEVTDTRLLAFSDEKCMQVLVRIADEFKTEFSIEEKIISIKKVRNDSGLSFEQGNGKGLISISKEQIDGKKLVTKLFAFGSEKNLPYNYKGGVSRLTIPPISNAWKVQEHGIIEDYYINEDIFPKREGTITATADPLTITDTGLDFDVNAQLLPNEVKAKITFTTGLLAGYMFEVKTYHHATKTFKLLVNESEKAFVVPSAAIKAVIGDKYFITDIIMPQSYVTAAENELRTEAQKQYDILSEDNFIVKAPTDPFYLQGITDHLELGSTVRIKDDDLKIDNDLAIAGYTRDLQNPYLYELILSDTIEVSQIVRDIILQEETQRVIKLAGLTDIAKLKLAWRTSQELKSMIFDTDNYFDMDNIRPLSIETSMLSVGARSSNFLLNILFSPNRNGNANSFGWSDGVLEHPIIEDTPRSWTISSSSTSSLTANLAYYIYARVQKVGNTGTIQVTTTEYNVDSQAGYYTLLIGVLHSVSGGYRLVSLTYGTTDIVGNQIKTGRIVSNDGSTWFDLNTGEFRGKFVFSSGDDIQDVVTGLDTSIGNVSQSVTNLNNYVDGSFSDNIIEESEAIAIEKYINSVNSEKAALDNKYNVIYTDPLLTGVSKTNLSAAKTSFNSAHANLLSSIANAIIDGKTTVSEKQDVDAKFTLYRSALATFETIFEQSIGFISQAKANIAESNATDVANAAQADATAAKNYIDNILPDRLDDIDAALDGLLEQHFHVYDPTLTNEPALIWDTTALKEEHLGDLFYNTDNGKSWRWVKTGTVYSWSEIVNSDLQAALQAASEAQDTADSKRRVFIIQPFTPYDLGDLWVQGASGDIMKCKTSKTSAQSYALADWEKASKYTDDTVANAAVAAASQAQSDADESNTVLDKIANDNILMPSEKPDVLQEWQIIQSEKPLIEAQATTYEIATQKTAYTNAYNTLNTYVTPLLANMATESVIVGTTFRARFKAYYYAKVTLLKSISDKAKVIADAAQDSANEADSKAQDADNKAQDVKDKTGVDSLPTGKVIIENGRISADLITSVGAVTGGSFNLGNGNFIVDVDGNLKAVGGEFSGVIDATSGTIGNFSIETHSFASRNKNASIFMYNYESVSNYYVAIGDNVLSVISGSRATARLSQSTYNTNGDNYGLILNATGSTRNNIGLYVETGYTQFGAQAVNSGAFVRITGSSLSLTIAARYVTFGSTNGGQEAFLPLYPITGQIISFRHPSQATNNSWVDTGNTNRHIISPGTTGSNTSRIGIRNSEHSLSLYFNGTHWYGI